VAGDLVAKDYLFFSTSTRDRNAAEFMSRIRMLLCAIAGLSLSFLGVCLVCFGKVR